MNLTFSIEKFPPDRLMAMATNAYENQNEAMLDWVDSAVHEYFVISMLERRFDLIPDYAEAIRDFCDGVHGLAQRIIESGKFADRPKCDVCNNDLYWDSDKWHCFECDSDPGAHKTEVMMGKDTITNWCEIWYICSLIRENTSVDKVISFAKANPLNNQKN